MMQKTLFWLLLALVPSFGFAANPSDDLPGCSIGQAQLPCDDQIYVIGSCSVTCSSPSQTPTCTPAQCDISGTVIPASCTCD